MFKKIILAVLVILAFLIPTVMVAAATYSIPTRQLSLGARGSDVSSLQTMLASDAALYPEGLVTGVYGPLTAQAVSRFQVKYGLPAVGRVGPQTLAKLGEIFGGVSDSSLGRKVSCGAGDTFNFVTGASCGPIIIQSMILSSSTVAHITATSADISWQTSASSTTKVLFATYPLSNGTSALILSSNSLGQSHLVSLSNLNPATLYYYVVSSTDPSGLVVTSAQSTFTTLTR